MSYCITRVGTSFPFTCLTASIPFKKSTASWRPACASLPATKVVQCDGQSTNTMPRKLVAGGSCGTDKVVYWGLRALPGNPTRSHNPRLFVCVDAGMPHGHELSIWWPRGGLGLAVVEVVVPAVLGHGIWQLRGAWVWL